MRLIDADKLHYIRKWFEDGYKSDVVVFAKEIDKAPTVEAIPIEWIEGIISLARKVGATRYAEELEVLIEDWREKNG